MKAYQTVILCLALFFLGMIAGKCSRKAIEPPRTIVKTDTVIVTTTVVRDNPVYVSESFIKLDTLVIEHTDTVKVAQRDTVFIPITQKYYEESDGRLRLWISGYKPNLDRFELDEQTQIVTNTVRRHWGLSAGVGPCVIYSPIYDGFDAGIGIFAGVTYTF